MLTIEMVFPSGRFHATPWGRHVNEGVPEWPPSPYRLVRALYDVWKRKRPDWPQSRVEPLLAALAGSPPKFCLPPANPAHTRSFLSQNLTDSTKRQLIFDGFVAVDPESRVLLVWPETTLDGQTEADLGELLYLANYLGRSESWVIARLVSGEPSIQWNCWPAETEEDDDAEIVPVACAVTPRAYQAHPPVLTAKKAARNKKKPVGGASALSWMDALACSTPELISARRSEPPAFRFVSYRRSSRCFEVEPRSRTALRRQHIHGVLYSLESKVLPSVVSTLEIAERVRRKLMGIHKAIVGDPAKVSPSFSGKDPVGRPLQGHQHVYILPQDRNHDGRLDHVMVICRTPLDEAEQFALDRLETIWQSHGKPDIRFIPIRWGSRDQLLSPAYRFASVTPLVLTRHYRQGRGEFTEWLATEICRELGNQGLPQPVQIMFLPKFSYRGGRSHRWLEFRRNRKEDQVRPGYGFELEFAEEVAGPFALGYGCHFGLGQFISCGLGEQTN
jgi:CRISPR-associated protein Csb2